MGMTGVNISAPPPPLVDDIALIVVLQISSATVHADMSAQTMVTLDRCDLQKETRLTRNKEGPTASPGSRLK